MTLTSGKELFLTSLNRKGWHSKNQSVTTKGDLLTWWHNGQNLHDSRILKNSELWDAMEDGLVGGCILGDSR